MPQNPRRAFQARGHRHPAGFCSLENQWLESLYYIQQQEIRQPPQMQFDGEMEADGRNGGFSGLSVGLRLRS